MGFEIPSIEKESPAPLEEGSRGGKLARAVVVGAALVTGNVSAVDAAGSQESIRAEKSAEGLMRKYKLSSESGQQVVIELPADPLATKTVRIDGVEQRVVRVATDRSAGSVVRLILEDGYIIVTRSLKNVTLDYLRKKEGCDSKSGECYDEFELEIHSTKP